MRLIEQLRWWAKECDRTNFGCQARLLLLEAADALEKAPDIVRCKDCLWYKAENGCPLNESGYFKDGKMLPLENDFCSYGEPRGERKE